MSKGGEDLTGIDQASMVGQSSPLREAEIAAGAQSGQGATSADSFQSIYNQEMRTAEVNKSMGSMDAMQEVSAGEIEPGTAVDLSGAQTIKEQLRESYAEMMEIRQMLLSAYDRLQREML